MATKDKFQSEHVVVFSSQCRDCKHQSAALPRVCNAFPGGIPMEIYLNKVSHKKPYKGDNGIRFEKKEEE